MVLERKYKVILQLKQQLDALNSRLPYYRLREIVHPDILFLFTFILYLKNIVDIYNYQQYFLSIN